MVDETKEVAAALDAKRAELEAELGRMSAPPEEGTGISFGKRVGEGTSIAVDRLVQVAAHDKLNAVLQGVMDDPAIVKSWADTGVAAYPKEQRSPQAAQALLHSEIARWGQVVRDNDIKPAE